MLSTTAWAAGVDLGGTNVRVAAVDPTGRVLGSRTARVVHDAAAGAPPFGQLVDLVAELAEQTPGRPAAIGVGVTGPVDVARGWVSNPYTLPPDLQGDLRGTLEAAFDVPVAVENDADAAALGEAWCGAGRDAERVLCVTVGTGIGVGLVAGAAPVRGARGEHAEAGHMVIDPGGPRCYCGASGCLESLSSGTAVARGAHGSGATTARAVFEAAAAGDPGSQAVVEAARTALALGVRNLIAAHAPDVAVLCGGALPGPEATRAAAQASVDGFTLGARPACRVRLGALGDLAGCLGAARSAFAAEAMHSHVDYRGAK